MVKFYTWGKMSDFVNAHFRYRPAQPDHGFRMAGYWVWGSSVIKAEDGRYHMFVSRWPKQWPFHPGWITDSEIVRATSDHPLGPFQFEEVVLGKRGSEYWDGQMAHNPRIVKYKGQYLLFYTGSTSPFPPPEPGEKLDNASYRTVIARSNKRTGVAVADSIYGPWRRFDRPLLPTKPGTFYSFLTSNTTPVINPDDSLYLMFKSRRYEGCKHSQMYIGAASSPNLECEFKVLTDDPIIGPGCSLDEVEDQFVWRESDGRWVLMAKDMTGSLCGEEGAGIIAVSADGLHWQLDSKPKAYSKTVVYADGSECKFNKRERPFVLFEDGRPRWLYTAVGQGNIYAGEPGADTWNQAVEIIG